MKSDTAQALFYLWV